MKKLLIAGLVIISAASFISCGGAKKSQIKGESFITEGWVDENTFRVTAMGVPKAGLTNIVQRKVTAKESALIMAQKRVIEKFVGARIEGASGSADAASTGIAVKKEFSGVVRGGTIVKVTYDEQQNCEIVYQVEKKGLKREVQGGATAL